MKDFYGPLIFSVCAVAIGALFGYWQNGIEGALADAFIILVLGLLEVALSFDNAVVNAKILAKMDNKWRHRFMTWGMPIAVIGMRIVFPLAIVAIAANIGPVKALMLALREPETYEQIITGAHLTIVGFGGTFLSLVGLKYFFDKEKDIHWLKSVEKTFARAGELYIVEVIIVLLGLILVAHYLPSDHQFSFLVSGVLGLVTFALVHWLDALVKIASTRIVSGTASAGLASFVYLEVVDASFSFDGVIGAFALTNSIIIIALGLGIGAVFVRTFTIMLVERGTLAQYRYLEHGAFWAILGLAATMFAGVFIHIPEWMIGLVGAVLIGTSLISSMSENKK